MTKNKEVAKLARFAKPNNELRRAYVKVYGVGELYRLGEFVKENGGQAEAMETLAVLACVG